MKKTKLKPGAILSIVLALIFCVSSAGCFGGTGGSDDGQPLKLVMGALSYNSSTKTVSWNKVTGAEGYALKIGDGNYSSEGITESGSSMQYILPFTQPGNYEVYVKAMGDNESFLTSEPAHKQVSIEIIAVKLVMGDLSYDNATKFVSWAEVENAIGYTLKLVGDGVDKTETVDADEINSESGKFEYEITESQSKPISVTVTAKGEGLNYVDSDGKTIVASYTVRATRLVMSNLSYNTETNTVSWDKVENAAGYTLSVNGTLQPSEDILESDTGMYYVLNEISGGQYTISVVAKGDGVVYDDSAPAAKQVNFAPKLVMGELSYNSTNRTVSWYKIAGATGYAVKINGIDKAVTITADVDRMQFTMKEEANATYTVSVIAKGNAATCVDSEPVTLNVNYIMPVLPAPAGATLSGYKFTWNPVSGATEYLVQVNNETPVSVGKLTYFLLATLYKNGTYTLKVKAADTYYTDSAFSQTVSYTASSQSISAGDYHSLAVAANGDMYGWGSNGSGRINGGSSNYTSPVLAGTGGFVAVSAGSSHSMAIDDTGTLYTWGANSDGQLGNGTTGSTALSPIMYGIKKFCFIAAGGYKSYAIDTDGNLWGWGNNANGYLGLDNGSTDNVLEPVQIQPGTKFAYISTSSGHTLAIDADGNLWGWGSNTSGQVGNGTTTNVTKPTKISTSYKFIEVSAGTNHSQAVVGTLGQTAYYERAFWGYNSYGQLGNGSSGGNATRPATRSSESYCRAASAGGGFSVFINSSSLVYTMGEGTTGKLGISSFQNISMPVQINSSVKFKKISAGLAHTLAVAENGSLYSWGLNWDGRLGRGNITDYNVVPGTVSGSYTFA